MDQMVVIMNKEFKIRVTMTPEINKDFKFKLDKNKSFVDEVLRLVQGLTNVTPDQIMGGQNERNANFVFARHLCFYLIRASTHFSYPRIGKRMGFDYTAVLYGTRKIAQFLRYNKDFEMDVQKYLEILKDNPFFKSQNTPEVQAFINKEYADFEKKLQEKIKEMKNA